MNARELIEKIKNGALEQYGHLYADTHAQAERYVAAIEAFSLRFGKDRDVYLFSVPGRSEISGNHTDHNHGMVLAGAIDRDIIAVVSPTDNKKIRLKSQGFAEDVVELSETGDPEHFGHYTSAALIAGICNAFVERGVEIGGFDAYTTTEVLKGSGISSSAAFEVMCANILNHLYAEGRFGGEELATIAQYAENVYFGKPCGLMDQMACAVGGFVHIDFADPSNPIVKPIPFSLSDAGYRLCIVNTGGNHADLNEDYASVPAEMKQVAEEFGQHTLRGITEEAFTKRIRALRDKVGDRAILRALHFLRENKRVEMQVDALEKGDIAHFLQGVMESGNSSFRYLQNVYTIKNVWEQGLSLALCLTEGYLAGKSAAFRVHGGGFAGTIQAFVKEEEAADYAAYMDSIFGKGATMMLRIRPEGAVQIQL